MRERIDPLIAERAPWLFSNRLGTVKAHRVLNRMLGYETTLRLAEYFRDRDTAEIMGVMGRYLAQDVQATGLENIPRQGPALIVANHPTGIADGVAVFDLLKSIRPDMMFFANRDAIRVNPRFSEMIIPVEWRQEHKTRGKAAKHAP